MYYYSIDNIAMPCKYISVIFKNKNEIKKQQQQNKKILILFIYFV